MIIFTPILERNITNQQGIPKYDGNAMSLEEFQNWKQEEEGIKYEWNNGVVEADEKIRTDEIYIFRNITKAFQIQNNSKNPGYFISEVNLFLKDLNKIRRPDIAFFNEDEIKKSKSDKYMIPRFIIEIVSDSNSANEIELKVREYFSNGVQVVWCIYPNLKVVKVYKSIREVAICLENDECDAVPVIPNFKISVNEIFE
jgi:Uma2 family endonuclease